MTRLELAQLLGFVLVSLALLILAATAATILYRRRADELEQWVAEQDAAAQEHAQERERLRKTMPVRAVEPPRPPSINDGPTRPIDTERLLVGPCRRELSTEPCTLLAGHPGPCEIVLLERADVPCGNGLDHPAHYYIEYLDTADPATPEMTRRPCSGIRSGPHRRRM